MQPSNGMLYQVNTRALLTHLGEQLGRPATFDDIPRQFARRIAALGFDVVYMLGVWQTGEGGLAMSARKMAGQNIPPSALASSPFAITSYTVNAEFGGRDALVRWRECLQRAGLRLVVDFVPNHVAIDHEWVESHPEYLVQGTAQQLQQQPHNFFQSGSHVIAHGKDPNYDGWTDTAQLNYRHPALRDAMVAVLDAIALIADGVRCDMAMLVTEEVFARTWGDSANPTDGTPVAHGEFWAAAISRTKLVRSEFVFMGEVYWDMEFQLQQLGFDFTYDKRLYDRLEGGDVHGVRAHLDAALDFQQRSVRFLENHDEPRAAAVFGTSQRHKCAAMVTYATAPGLRFFHMGQLQGRTKFLSMHLNALHPEEVAVQFELSEFYEQLLAVCARDEVKYGTWEKAQTTPSDHDDTHTRLVGGWWAAPGTPSSLLLVITNFHAEPSSGHVLWPQHLHASLPRGDGSVFLRDVMGPHSGVRDAGVLQGKGLWVGLPAFGFHVFRIIRPDAWDLGVL